MKTAADIVHMATSMSEHFENLQVQIDDLPKVEEINFKLIDKNYLKVMILSSAIFFLLIGIGIFCLIFFSDDMDANAPLYTGIPWIIFLGLNITFTILAFKRRKYALRERDVIYSKGLIWSVRTAIPFNRIQHAEIKQGPIERKFGLSSLKVFTAGGQSSDLVIPGLPSEKAQQLKDFVLGKTAEDGSGSEE